MSIGKVFSLFFLLLMSVQLHAQTDNLIVTNLSGEDLSTTAIVGGAQSGVLEDKVSEAGSTQFIRVSTDQDLTAASVVFQIQDPGDEVKVVNAADGSDVTYATNITLDNGTQSRDFLIVGLDDTDEDGEQNATLTFEINDPGGPITDENTFALTVTNADNDGGLADNVAPSEPTQRFPLDGSEVATNETFLFEHAYDADEDTLTYQLCVRSDSDASIPLCASIGESAIVEGSGVASVGWPILAAVLLSSMLYWFNNRRRRRVKATHIVQFAPQVKKRKVNGLAALLVVVFLGACGNQALLDALNVSPRPSVGVTLSTFTNVTPGNTYRWRVYADDGNGNITPTSEEYSFTARTP